MKYGKSFSTEFIDNNPLPKVSKDLLPWLLKDRQEAIDGTEYLDSKKNVMVHAGDGLTKAEKNLKQANNMLAKNPADTKLIEIIRLKRDIALSKIEFYKGKLYLIDKIIAETKKQ